MNNFYRLGLGALLTLSLTANASVIDCPAANIRHIQVESYGVLVYLEGQNWHKIGNHDQAGTKEKLSLLLAAQAAGKKVTIRYPGNYDCKAYNISTDSLMVRTHN